MGAVRLVLVRHGESQWNAAGILQGHGGPGLTGRGRAQAAATARVLGRDPTRVVAIVRSDLPRVVETAAPTEDLLGVPVTVDERLREIDVGSWSGLTRAQAAAADPEDYDAWTRGVDVAPGGGETFAALRDRVVAGLADVVAGAEGGGGARAEGATVLVFTHGGPIRVAVAGGLGLPAGGHRSLKPVGNCAVSIIDVPTPGALASGRALLAAYNRTDHLVTGAPG